MMDHLARKTLATKLNLKLPCEDEVYVIIVSLYIYAYMSLTC